jgi:hypothetical protein
MVNYKVLGLEEEVDLFAPQVAQETDHQGSLSA